MLFHVIGQHCNLNSALISCRNLLTLSNLVISHFSFNLNEGNNSSASLGRVFPGARGSVFSRKASLSDARGGRRSLRMHQMVGEIKLQERETCFLTYPDGVWPCRKTLFRFRFDIIEVFVSSFTSAERQPFQICVKRLQLVQELELFCFFSTSQFPEI